jgi:hypothetical protein
VGKKNDAADLAKLVEDLIEGVGEDRARLTDFLDDLLQTFKGEQSVGIAEYVAKLMDAATRQHQVKVSMIKTLTKNSPADDEKNEMDELRDSVGLPFEADADEGSN